MEVLRVPPYPITTKWDVPAANTAYSIYIEDLVDHSYETSSVTSDSNSQVSYILPRSKVQFDREFLFQVLDSTGEIVVDDNLSVYRPYVNPNDLGTTIAEINEYRDWEIIARSIMDQYILDHSANGDAFYNHKLVIIKEGQGNDYFPLWHNVNRVLKVYENNILIYNGEDVAITIPTQTPTISSGTVTLTTSVAHGFEVGNVITISGLNPSGYNGTTITITAVPSTTSFSFASSTTGNITVAGTVLRIWPYEYKTLLDNSAIARVEADGYYNRNESTPLRIPAASGDLGAYSGASDNYVAFPSGFDYTFILDAGFKTVPPDIQLAAKILVEELKCGTNLYYNKYVTEYSTDQFDVKFATDFLKGTGNIIVDKILNNYKGNVFKPAIL
jgi:hypothetical protein